LLLLSLFAGSETHFKVVVVSENFHDKPLIQVCEVFPIIINKGINRNELFYQGRQSQEGGLESTPNFKQKIKKIKQ